MAIHHAESILKSVHGKHLSSEERTQKAVSLAAEMLLEANRTQTRREKKVQAQLARMMRDLQGKAFTTAMSDQCFRSSKSGRIAEQMVYLLDQFGIPSYLDPLKQLELRCFQWFGKPLSFLFAPVAKMAIRSETSAVILPGERAALSKHMQKRRQEGVRLNLNHLGEAILGEEEAKRRLQVYLHDLQEDDVEYVSVKISTIFSQINLLSWKKTLDQLAERLRLLYRTAMQHPFTGANGKKVMKFVNLDMEEYRDLILTKELFKNVLSEKEFFHFSAGIVLQAYLPDAHNIQKELTEWAMERFRAGGAPIKIRIVKGANLAMEQFEASLRGWEQAPYKTKSEVDANYKRMIAYGCQTNHAAAVHIGVASHNLFDIAYAMLHRAENRVETEVTFEMLEGMADHIRRVVQHLTGGMLLYCPVATQEDFQSAVAYLLRRLDENTGPENFLRATFGLKPETPEWSEQVRLFSLACKEIDRISLEPRRKQNRLITPRTHDLATPFENEPDTDFSLPHNREWALQILSEWKHKKHDLIPLVICGKEHHQSDPEGKGNDPSHPSETLYRYSIANWTLVNHALDCAEAQEEVWANTDVEKRCHLMLKVAQKMREAKPALIGVMAADGGKTVYEADPEISEAIDFAEYYARSRLKMDQCKDISWKPVGTILVAPPWNFPISIPAGGIIAALLAGNPVLFKPAAEAVMSGWELVKTFWDAGVPKEALQFLNCHDDPVGSQLISDPRLKAVILTGATSTAKLFLKMRPGLQLAAETGGKNAMIITEMADRDLAIKELVQSAFGHAGQKCSAASLAILEAPVYDDPHFLAHLKDAVQSLRVGSPWDPSSKVTPLIREAGKALYRGLTHLDPGETWLVKPQQDKHNPNLWSPGVKLGVVEGSFMHQTELFGPILGIMRAKTLVHAVKLANGTPYGLTSGLQTLDIREQSYWIDHIEAGNCYINRGMTGAIVRRQPFGGCKASSFGTGAKAGGPNYVAQFAKPQQVDLPKDSCSVSDKVNKLNNALKTSTLSTHERALWSASLGSYALWAKRYLENHDPSKVLGQDNLFRCVPIKGVVLRIQTGNSELDILRCLAAAFSVGNSLHISWSHACCDASLIDRIRHQIPNAQLREESEEKFCRRIQSGEFKRVRLLSPAGAALEQAATAHGVHLAFAPVLANGRFELHHYVREIALSIDYHRYGNLGVREGEVRKLIL